MHGAVPDDIDYINDTPTVQEYKKLKRVMRIMVKFYEGGSATKLQQAEFNESELKKIEEDQAMVEAQLESLAKYPIHPKRREYEEELKEELENLLKSKKKYASKSQEYRKLHEWSNGIVMVTQWLESGLDDYCVNFLKMELNITVVPPEKLTKEKFASYKEGLDEITYNLQESQDFFCSSLDGRLKQYHQMEKDIIQAQIDVLSKFNPENLRQQHLTSELTKDLEYVSSNMGTDPSAMEKRKKMLEMHSDFFKVLRWYREKMKALGDEYGIVDQDKRSDEEKIKSAMSSQVEFMSNLTPENTPELDELKKLHLHHE